MYIPETIKVRVRHDKDYNNSTVKKADNIPLAFITYVDEKGLLKKEKSWNGWGDEYIGEFTNQPMTGYKLENMVTRSRNYFGSGRSMYRLVNPHGFAFEITTDNFFEICMDTTIVKGVIQEECILAWDGLSLALLVSDSDICKEYKEATKLVLAGHITPSELVVGNLYQNKAGKCVGYYMGKFPFASTNSKDIGGGYANPTSSWHRGEYTQPWYKITTSFKGYMHVFANKETWWRDVDGHMTFNKIKTPQLYNCSSTKFPLTPSDYTLADASGSSEIFFPHYDKLDDGTKAIIGAMIDVKIVKSYYGQGANASKNEYEVNWKSFPKATKK